MLGLVHASRDVFAKLWKLYRPRVMGGCLEARINCFASKRTENKKEKRRTDEKRKRKESREG